MRVTCSETLGFKILTGEIARFAQQHPGIIIDLSVENKVIDLSRREADVALRATRPSEGDLFGRKLADIRWGLFASAGLERAIYPPTANLPSALGARSPMNASKFEWATLPLNSRNFVRRGQVFKAISVPSNLPDGCSGKANQKPVASEPAATLSR